MDGGRAKGAVGVGGRWEGQGCGGSVGVAGGGDFFGGNGGKSGVGGLTGVGLCGRIGVQLKDCLIVKLMDRFLFCDSYIIYYGGYLL